MSTDDCLKADGTHDKVSFQNHPEFHLFCNWNKQVLTFKTLEVNASSLRVIAIVENTLAGALPKIRTKLTHLFHSCWLFAGSVIPSAKHYAQSLNSKFPFARGHIKCWNISRPLNNLIIF